MKKNIVLLWVAAILMLIASIIMTVLYVKENESKSSIVNFSVSLLNSYSNAVDYTLCSIDNQLWNVHFDRCQEYLDIFVDDTKELRKNFDLKTRYEYIGD